MTSSARRLEFISLASIMAAAICICVALILAGPHHTGLISPNPPPPAGSILAFIASIVLLAAGAGFYAAAERRKLAEKRQTIRQWKLYPATISSLMDAGAWSESEKVAADFICWMKAGNVNSLHRGAEAFAEMHSNKFSPDLLHQAIFRLIFEHDLQLIEASEKTATLTWTDQFWDKLYLAWSLKKQA